MANLKAKIKLPAILTNRYVTLALRIGLGAIFILAGLTKLPYQAEFFNQVVSYYILPVAWAKVFSSVLPWVELLVGCLLVLGAFTRSAAAATSLLALIFIAANIIGFFSSTPPQENASCGCFGLAIVLSRPESLALDVILLAIGIYLFFQPSRFLSLDSMFIKTKNRVSAS